MKVLLNAGNNELENLGVWVSRELVKIGRKFGREKGFWVLQLRWETVTVKGHCIWQKKLYDRSKGIPNV